MKAKAKLISLNEKQVQFLLAEMESYLLNGGSAVDDVLLAGEIVKKLKGRAPTGEK